MSRSLPPLNGLRAFEAVARHLHLGRAAQELHVTTGAISQQIKLLESYLDVKLFHRQGRGLVLSEEAERAVPALQQGFSLLVEASRTLQSKERATELSIWAPPSFASKWLMPRMVHFLRRNSDIDLQLSASEAMIERGSTAAHAVEQIQRERVDISFVFGYVDAHFPDCHVDNLFEVSAVPLCSPVLQTGSTPLMAPSDLRLHTLLHDDTDYDNHPTWRRWVESAGIVGLNTKRGIRLSSVQLALDAAIEGQGVVLSLDVLAQRDVAAGRLCVPFGPALKLRRRFLMVTRKEALFDPAVDAFRKWILTQN